MRISMMRLRLSIVLALILIVATPNRSYSDFGMDLTSSTITLNDAVDEDLQQEIRNLSAVNMSDVIFNVTSSGGEFDGYNLFTLQQKSRLGLGTQTETLIVDMEGNVIASVDMQYPVEWMNSTTVMGRKIVNHTVLLWNFYTGQVTNIPFVAHHELEYNSINNTIFGLTIYEEVINGSKYAFDLIQEVNMTGNVIWSLDTQEFISHTQWCPFQDIYLGAADISHGNTVFFDSEEEVLFFNARNVNTFYKINHSTGEVIWALGEYGDFTLFDSNGNEKSNLFFHSHSLEQVDDYEFIIFDNDLHNQTNLYNEQSRILEIRINESTMTANESWSRIVPHEYYSFAIGDADRLPNGNRLGTFGTPHHLDPVRIGARLVEFDPLGNMVWELNFPLTDLNQYQIYRMERFRFRPILSSSHDLVINNESITVSWDAWYNFRPKRTMPGTYVLYLNDMRVDEGSLQFDKFWRPVRLAFAVDELVVGINNLTLAVYDDIGHRTTDTVIADYSTTTSSTTNGGEEGPSEISVIIPILIGSGIIALVIISSRYRIKIVT